MVLLSYLKQTNPFVRFLLVGVINTSVGLSTIFFIMNGIGSSYWVATFLGNSVGAGVSFLLNRTFTFNSSTSYAAGGLRFLVVILCCYFFSYTASDFITEQLFTSKQEIAVIIGTGLYTITNYYGQKWYVFFK